MNLKNIAYAAMISASAFLASCGDEDVELEIAPIAEVGPGSATDFLNNIGQDGDRVFFKYNKSEVTAEGKAALDKQMDWLVKYPNVLVTVEGHCDVRGTNEYNLALGNRRAEAVKAYLVSKGISAERIHVISYGKERPEAAGNDEASHARNRRGVTVIAQ